MQIDGGAVDDREIHLAAVQPLDQMPAIALHDAQRDIGKFVDDAAGQSSGQHRAHRRHQPEDDAARRIAVGRFQIVADLFDLANEPRGAVEQHPAGAGQQHAAAVADEQLDAKLVLEQLDVPAQRGLGGAQPVRRLAEAAEFRHGPEGAQLFEVHRMPSVLIPRPSYAVSGKSVQLEQCSHDMRVNVGRDGPRAMLLIMEVRSSPGIPDS